MNSSLQQVSTSAPGTDGMTPYGLQQALGGVGGTNNNNNNNGTTNLLAGHGAFGSLNNSGMPNGQSSPNGMNGSNNNNSNNNNNSSSNNNSNGMSKGMGMPGGTGGGAGASLTSHQDFLSAQARERGRVLQALQQQQQQQQRQQQLSSMTRGFPVLQSMAAAGHDIRNTSGNQRFMVDDFAGAGALLSRPEQEFLLARSGYTNMAAPGMSAFPQAGDAMDLSHPSKLADFLLVKQAAALNGAHMLHQHQQQQPKVTRLPCQARGMKADHNSTSAFFEIPEDARHGQHLLCSHPACRSSGVKFRYCLYCKKPVTKQNFRSRHLHADLDPNHNSKMGKLTRKRSHNDKGGDGESVENDHDDDDEQQQPSSKRIKKEQAPSGPPQSRPVTWAALLKERPTGLDTMSTWIGRVLSASDPKTPLATAAEDDETDSKEEKGNNNNSSSTRTGRWNSLLKQRMTAGSSSGSEMDVTKWLTDVLKVSAEPEDEESVAEKKQKEDVKKVDKDSDDDDKVAKEEEKEDKE